MMVVVVMMIMVEGYGEDVTVGEIMMTQWSRLANTFICSSSIITLVSDERSLSN